MRRPRDDGAKGQPVTVLTAAHVIISLIPLTILSIGDSTISILEIGRWKFRELPREHMASDWHNWGLSSGRLFPDPVPYALCLTQKPRARETHLKSPSSFSCCTSFATMGPINTLFTTVPRMKYPKMLTGPSQPVLKCGAREGVERDICPQASALTPAPVLGSPCPISEPPGASAPMWGHPVP